MKYLGIDYGTKRTGIAISDSSARLSVVKETISSSVQKAVIERIKNIVVEEKVDSIIVGMPLNLSGEKTEMSEMVARFIEKLRNHVTIPVQTTDERLTSQMAEKILRGINKKERDQVAAQIFLQNFLDGLSSH
ncbi:MAG: hypothetical protein A2233_02310 [Candidatus Kerfeldbacteria bacterium RIFOXYA2_FULL_38_24]|uniref:Putative pre-16S rRNA nuclease n=1 Tax=Candidatus Kerfeldbacteria bacterium RIFOXYB2_FULL_38_14 TaxID=1798547 RepID=A0A1G2BF16_9BACT|nr:MAG: hypothetical protein A2319_04910 [Candidatus Kerfeldbacteria bacterium RIFOXYB2_FULL_38_14]OGY87944.1 MAG: hypothetical protein A2233_02310 [Candidatus Kerfeldbacteria bacterium RIFOXYA2_FULL_38_24]OGY88644.1 MAG: hypothetical protein A2458_03290 [Candidatus Kerfeldbacteria bacterium RIFOXYC2_FULL_38_9]